VSEHHWLLGPQPSATRGVEAISSRYRSGSKSSIGMMSSTPLWSCVEKSNIAAVSGSQGGYLRSARILASAEMRLRCTTVLSKAPSKLSSLHVASPTATTLPDKGRSQATSLICILTTTQRERHEEPAKVCRIDAVSLPAIRRDILPAYWPGHRFLPFFTTILRS
jgi:hypothetical protein